MIKRLCLLALSLFLALKAEAQESATSSQIETAEETSTPVGWKEFCQNYSSECDLQDRTPVVARLSPAQIAKLQRINKQANSMVKPTTDQDHWGFQEQWNLPTHLDPRADCEDIALLKKKMLEKAGFPRSALLLAVVKQTNGERHVVLVVKTDTKDLILDNLTDDIDDYTKVAFERENRYEFIKMQADYNENLWLRVASSNEPAPASESESFAERLRGTFTAR